MAESNFQDVVVLSSATLQVRGQAMSVGTDAGAKSIIFGNDVAALSMAANPTAGRAITVPDANGTLGLITAISAGAALISNGQVVFSNSNGVSFGANGSTITASYTQSTGPAAISAGTTLASSGTVVFSNSNAISFGLNGNTVTASFSQSVQPGVTAIGVSTGGNTAGNTGTTQGTYILAGAGAVSLSQSTAAGSLATVSISVTLSTAPGGIAAGTQTATSGTVVFSNSNGVTFGMSNSSVITASVATQPARISLYSQWAEFATNQAVGNGSLSVQKLSMPMAIHATQAVLGLVLTGNSGSSGALTASIAIYTINGSTLSLSSSASRQISWTSGSATSASSQYGGVSGTRLRTIGFDVSLTPGDYMLAFNFSTTNDGTWRALGRQGVNLVGTYDGVETSLYLDGFSTSTTGGFPASIALTNTNYVRTTPQALMQPGAMFIGT